LSADGFDHVNVLYNLHSAIQLGTVTSEVTHSGIALTITHSFCPNFHNIHSFKEAIKGLFANDQDQDYYFRHLEEVSQLMKGNSNLVCGKKQSTYLMHANRSFVINKPLKQLMVS